MLPHPSIPLEKMNPHVKSVLVDARNWADLKQPLIEKISESGLIGFDIETHDEGRHPGLTQFMKATKKLVFDVNRTTVTGFSFYVDGDDTAYYVNLAHADVENRIPWSEARQLLDAKPATAHWIAHNAPFEITMMNKSLGYFLANVICTLQMAVSTFNEDQYPFDAMRGMRFGGLGAILTDVARNFAHCDPQNLNEEQSEVLSKVIAKTSIAKHSYNGLVRELSYGYGLKKLTESFWGYKQTSFEEVLNGKEHMGQLTGDEVVHYGADDAYWAVRNFHKLLAMMAGQNDKIIDTFFEQENPMIYVFSDIWQQGMRIDADAVLARRDEERQIYADAIRELQKAVRESLPFPDEPNKYLMAEDWYKKGWEKYRKQITDWASRTLPSDDFDCVMTTRGPVSNAWAAEKGVAESRGPNFSHYMPMRTLMYDLPGLKPAYKDGKVASDKKARDKMKGKGQDAVLEKLNQLSGIEQRMKLYLTPYLQLIDPETSRVYPVVSSKLNSRRMASSFPNPMQLAKRGEATYIRGFYLPDEDDHVVMSIDWSQIELVLIGDFSGDPGFYEAYGKKPYKDLHWKAVADMFEITVEEAKARPDGKKLRTDVGKGSNFNYWYSGALSTVGDTMGWSSDKMWEMTQKYRDTFPVAEQWRVDLIAEAREKGFITLPDGHRRVRYEATYEWQNMWRDRWDGLGGPSFNNFGNLFVKSITNRAGNQIVNSMIQGSCATMAKRSILRINKMIKERGFRARFMIPIHDELVFSVHRDDVVEFHRAVKEVMCHHPDLIKTLEIDATASIGRTFEPYHPEKAPFGQIELDEAPVLEGYIPAELKDTRLDDAHVQRVIHYLFKEAA